MSAQLAGLRPQRYTAATYEAFRLADGLKEARALLAAASRKEAVEQGKTRCFHKDKLVIRETGESGTILHFYAIRKGRAFWDGRQRVEPLHEDWLFSMDADLDKAPFRVVRG
jgi:hypothetical protein